MNAKTTTKTVKTETKTTKAPAAKKSAKVSNVSLSNQSPVTTQQSAPETKTTKTFSERLIEALKTRNSEQPSKDIDIALSNVSKGQNSINNLYAQPAWCATLDSLVSKVSKTDKKSADFIAVKVLVKIAHAMIAIGSGVKSEFDPYSRTIIENLAHLNEISNKSTLVCLSKSVEYDALDQEAALKARYNCSPTTAGTQSSSTRMMLQALNLCAVSKGKRGDVTTAHDNEQCKQLIVLFKGSV